MLDQNMETTILVFFLETQESSPDGRELLTLYAHIRYSVSVSITRTRPACSCRIGVLLEAQKPFFYGPPTERMTRENEEAWPVVFSAHFHRNAFVNSQRDPDLSQNDI